MLTVERPNTKTLILDCNLLGNEGAKTLARLLPQLTSLSLLGLQGNRIGEEGIYALFLFSYSHPKRPTFGLFGNRVRCVVLLESIKAEAKMKISSLVSI